MPHTGHLTFLRCLAVATLLLGAVLWRQRSRETLRLVSVGAEAPARTRSIRPGSQPGESLPPSAQVSGLCPPLPKGRPRQAPGRSAPGPASSPQAISALSRSVRSQVSPLAPPPSSPSAADEEALLRLLDDTNRAANDVDRRERLTAICVRWAAFDPPAAIALALESGLDPLEGALVPNLAQQWATQDFASAQAWAARLGPGELRDEVYSRLAYEMALADPAAAAHLLSQLRPAGSAREEATLTVVHAWAQRDLAAASSWVHTFAAGPLRERAIAELATAPR